MRFLTVMRLWVLTVTFSSSPLFPGAFMPLRVHKFLFLFLYEYLYDWLNESVPFLNTNFGVVAIDWVDGADVCIPEESRGLSAGAAGRGGRCQCEGRRGLDGTDYGNLIWALGHSAVAAGGGGRCQCAGLDW
mmetsp:Transcript_105152/g.206248  ORF Transcript_105152/g.206248 Transcript_105152/m.206248 type:complete len:132 (+) Transcript_105152:2439-2834(+)